MTTEEETPATQRRMFHPLSGALIIGIDVLLWGGLEVLTLELAAPISASAAFLGVGLSVAWIQKFTGDDSIVKSLAKGFIGGVAAGVPTPIAGGILGGLILSSSGLNFLSRKRVK